MSRLRRRLLTGALVLGFLALLGAWGALALGGVARDLRQAEDLVDAASASLTDGRLADARAELDEAQELIVSANESLRGSLALDVLAWMPVVRQNLLSLEDSVEVAAVVIHGGVRILDASSPLESPSGTLEVSLSAGTIPLDAVAAAQEEIAALNTQLLPIVRDDEPSLLLPPVQELRTTVYEEARERRQQLGVLDRGLQLLSEMAGASGPRRYLLAVSNTAEMRGSGGMILNYGVLEGKDGTIELTDFGRIDELALAGPVSEDLVPADYAARWAGFDPLSRFRQANLAGDFTVVAPVLEAMYTASTQQPVNGVIQVDPQGLAAVLQGVGPVTVPEVGEVRADNVVALTLNEAYLLFPDVENRSDVLGDVAEAAFRRLVDGDFPSLRPLAESLATAVDGRHLLMHTTAAGAQDSVTAFGADGAYPSLEGGDVIALTAQNLSGNKLDYYLDTDLQLAGDRPAGEEGALTARVTLTNTAPAGSSTPAYIFGPGPGATPQPAGVLRSLVTLYLPLGTSLVDASGDAPVEPVSSGTEDGRPYVSFIVDVPASQARSVELSLRLAPRLEGAYALTVLPTPRVRPTTLGVDIATERGAVEAGVELNRGWVLRADAAPVPLTGPAFR